MQHHDAVTGTERQPVADDYQFQIDSIINSTLVSTSKMLKSYFEQKFGQGSIESVKFCTKTHDKFIECPKDLFDTEKEGVYLVISKSNEDDIVRMRLPSSNYKLINPISFLDVPNQFVQCKDETDCTLHVRDGITGLVIYKVVKDSGSTYLAKSGNCSRVWNQYQSLMLVRMQQEKAIMWYVSCDTPREDPMFGDKSACAERNITVSLRNYPAYEGDGQPSGAYIFRPQNGTEDSEPYWKINGFNCNQHPNDTYGSLVISSDKGDVSLTILKDDLLGLQILTEFTGIEDTGHGAEITLNIEAIGFDNGKEFYTDSNGLQMQRRILDKRPDFDLKVEGTEHITANYYPINSAISMRDQRRGDFLTLLNDRCQGGSALKPDRLELMIDRRLYLDDLRGLEEALNETDPHGKPLPVSTHSILLLERSISEFAESNGYSRIKAAQKRLASNVEASVAKSVSLLFSTLLNSFIYLITEALFSKPIYI